LKYEFLTFGRQKRKSKTINSRDSLVVTHPTTSLPAYGLSKLRLSGREALFYFQMVKSR
jgi:hypothetical protein